MSELDALRKRVDELAADIERLRAKAEPSERERLAAGLVEAMRHKPGITWSAFADLRGYQQAAWLAVADYAIAERDAAVREGRKRMLEECIFELRLEQYVAQLLRERCKP